MAADEAEGRSLWTEDFHDRVRVRIWQETENATGGPGKGIGHVTMLARRMLLESEGITSLAGVNPKDDLHAHLRKCASDAVPDVVEALYWAFVDQLADLQHFGYDVSQPDEFERALNQLLSEHRLSFELIHGQMIPRESQELHQAVVAPALQLLAGRGDLAAAEQAYQDAIRELSDGNAGDAITDAATALQETLVGVGCEGKSLGRLLVSARRKGLLAPHDGGLGDVAVKALEWVSADRSNSGDAHSVTDATREDAWLTVHIVGALILRLASGRGRQMS